MRKHRSRPGTSAFAAGVLAALSLTQPSAAAENPVALTNERARVQQRFPEAFAGVTDVDGLPRVLLIGDSISIGYTPPVRKLLAGSANDLYAFVLPQVDRLQQPNNVHFTPTGYDRLAGVVAGATRSHLPND